MSNDFGRLGHGAGWGWAALVGNLQALGTKPTFDTKRNTHFFVAKSHLANYYENDLTTRDIGYISPLGLCLYGMF